MSLEPTKKEPELLGEELTVNKETESIKEELTISKSTEVPGEKLPTVSQEVKIVTKKKKKKKKDKGKNFLSRNSVSLLRTTLRNNTELTSIADNKANVLLSLNALMLTFFVPLILPNIDLVRQNHLEIPLVLLVLTCISTIYIAVLVLKPGKFGGQNVKIEDHPQLSPFFFGNFEKMSKEDYLKHFNKVLRDDKRVEQFLPNDFYHLGLRLGEKMKLVRRAFNIFIIGLVGSVILSTILIFIYS